MKNLITLFVLLMSIQNCVSDDLVNTKSVNIDEAFTIEFQQEAILAHEPFQMKIVDVIEDSRCPLNDRANCFWSGQVRVEVEIKIENQIINRELMFRIGKETPLIYGEYTIQIEEVLPENQIDEMIELKDYDFKLKINKQAITAAKR